MDTGPQSQPFGRQDPSLPQVFGRYLLVQRLSRGGMGEIFVAKHGLSGFEKLAVIKKVLPNLAADEQFISRFVDEAQVAIKLQHVNVAQVFEVGRVGNEYFLALEYIEGRDLRRILGLLGHRHQRMPVDLALFIARELANGLAYAHRRTTSDGSSLNLVHCDISPPNVLVSFEGETKVIDFGIAKSAMRATATDPKLGFGKFGYMAPEQLIRGGMVDHRTDIYAAGVVLFELLTGTRLYEAGPQPDYRGLARKVARGEFPLPSQVEPDLARYDDLVNTALRPRPEDRYQSAAELRDAIQQCLVAVNPTISTDQLGSYMRELFADEMSAQRELHERVASAHLADFQAQFHTQTISTVSFALAQLPLQPPDATGPVVQQLAAAAHSAPTAAPPLPPSLRHRSLALPPMPGTRNTGPNPLVGSAGVRSTGPNPLVGSAGVRSTGPNPVISRNTAPVTPVGAIGPVAPVGAAASSPALPKAAPLWSPAYDAMAPSTGPIESYTLDNAATIVVGGGSHARMMARRRRLLAIVGGTAFGVIAVFGIWGLAKSDNRARASQSPAAAAQPTPNPAMTVEPIPVAPTSPTAPSPTAPSPTAPSPTAAAAAPGARAGSPDEIEISPREAAATDRSAAAVRDRARVVQPDASHRIAHKESRPGIAAPVPPTREQLGQKFQQVRREYDGYKAKFGSRLEKEWGDLAMFIQYASEDSAWRTAAAHRIDEFRSRMRE